MKGKTLSVPLCIIGAILGLIGTVRADVPPPPVNQNLGILDSVFDLLAEEDCRYCHNQVGPDNDGDGVPDYPVDTTYLPSRHHLLVNTPMPAGSVAPNGDPNGDGFYECLSCHAVVWDPELAEFVLDPNFRDCTLCHVITPHHVTAQAQAGDCQHCHGSLVNNRDDGHYIPTDPPTTSTPRPGLGSGPNGEGGCRFCHDTGVTSDGRIVSPSNETHHGTQFYPDCMMCHGLHGNFNSIRNCEVCHGIDALHNIQTDSNGDGVVIPGEEAPYFGHIGSPTDCGGCHIDMLQSAFVPESGSVAPHIDMLQSASVPESGPVTPQIDHLSPAQVRAGEGASISVAGFAFTNVVQTPEGPTVLSSDVSLEASDGGVTTLPPTSVSESTMVVAIPASLLAGRYSLRAVKTSEISNKKVLILLPTVVLSSAICDAGTVTVAGSGFGGYLDAADSGTSVTGTIVTIIGGGKKKPKTRRETETATILSWTGSEIVAQFSACPEEGSVEVHTVWDVSGGAPLENCGDGIDNDGDGLVDCDDSDCAGDDPACPADCTGNEKGFCNDGLDNDCDGKTDCGDPNCRKDPVCR
jgi:hypothetical protein